MGTVLQVERVHKRYGEVAALAGVSLTIQGGEFFTLLGPSGCGKTTLLRCVAGFLRPDDGRILCDGDRLDRLPAHKRDIGMVFQNYAIFPHLTVFENVAYGLHARRVEPPRSGGGRWRRSRSCRWMRWPIGGRISCRAGSSSGSRWPAPWRFGRGSC